MVHPLHYCRFGYPADSEKPKQAVSSSLNSPKLLFMLIRALTLKLGWPLSVLCQKRFVSSGFFLMPASAFLASRWSHAETSTILTQPMRPVAQLVICTEICTFCCIHTCPCHSLNSQENVDDLHNIFVLYTGMQCPGCMLEPRTTLQSPLLMLFFEELSSHPFVAGQFWFASQHSHF